MTYTILSARYANPDNSAAVLSTEEAGDVVASQADTPELWAQMLQGTVQPFQPPSFAALATVELDNFRTLREMFLNRVAGIAVAALISGDTVVRDAAAQVRQGLLDLPDSAPVQAAIAAQDIAALHLAIKTQYAAVVGGVPDSAKAAFAKVDA